MAGILDTPRVWIDGVPIPASIDPYRRGVAALQTITIPWGRSSIYDAPEANAATLELLDVRADRWERSTMLGSRVQVMRGDDVVLLDGTVREATIAPVTITLGSTPREALRVSLTIADIWASWETMTPAGPWAGAPLRGQGGTIYGWLQQPWMAGGWDRRYPETRAAELLSWVAPWVPAMDVPPKDVPEPPAPYRRSTSATAAPLMSGVRAADKVSLAEHVRRLYRAVEPLGWAEIEPGVRVRQGRPQPAGPVRLVTSPTSLTLSAPGCTHVPARSLGLEAADAGPLSSAADRIREITMPVAEEIRTWLPELRDGTTGAIIREEQTVTDDLSSTITIPVANALGATTSHELDATADAGWYAPIPDDRQPSTKDSRIRGYNGAAYVAWASAEAAGVLNDTRRYPKLTYRPAAGAPIDALLRCTASGPLLIRSSKWAHVSRMPKQLQLIGGVLRWTAQGWRHDLQLAPAIDRSPYALTLAQTLGLAQCAIGAVAPDLTIADLATLTEETTT